MDSNAVSGIAERIAEGKLTVRVAANFAREMKADGSTKARQNFDMCCCVCPHDVFSCLFMFSLGPLKVSTKQLAACRERDFFRWVKLPMPIYNATVPVHVDATSSSAIDGKGMIEIAMILPSDHLQALHAQGDEAPHCACSMSMFSTLNMFLGITVDNPQVMKECLGSWSDFGDLWRANESSELASTHIPMIFHEDAVPHFSGTLAKKCCSVLYMYKEMK